MSVDGLLRLAGFGSLGVVTLSVLALAIVARRVSSGVFVASVVSLLFIFGITCLAGLARSVHLLAQLFTNPQGGRGLGDLVHHAGQTLQDVGVGVAAVVVMLAGLCAWWSHRRPEDRSVGVVSLLCLLPVLVAASALARYGVDWQELALLAERRAGVVQFVTDGTTAFRHLLRARELVFVVGAIVTVVSVARVATTSPRPTSRRLTRSLAALVLLAGVLTYLGSQPRRRDARAPVDVPWNADSWVARSALFALSDPSQCAPSSSVPLLTCVPAGMLLDEHAVSPAELVEDLQTLQHNYAILYPRRPFDGRLNLTIARSSNVSECLLAAELAADVGYVNQALLGRTVRSVPSATFGAIGLDYPCVVPFDRAALPASTLETGADFVEWALTARGAGRAAGPLGLAPGQQSQPE